jgi:hypothetical protein
MISHGRIEEMRIHPPKEFPNNVSQRTEARIENGPNNIR